MTQLEGQQIAIIVKRAAPVTNTTSKILLVKTKNDLKFNSLCIYNFLLFHFRGKKLNFLKSAWKSEHMYIKIIYKNTNHIFSITTYNIGGNQSHA